MKTALQLYSIRNYLKDQLPKTLNAVREMGYDGVEWFSLMDRTPEELATLTRDAGLEIFSLFIDMDIIAACDDTFAKRVYNAGFRYLVLGSLPDERRAGGPLFAQTCCQLRKYAECAKRNGLYFLYHNHDFDLTPVPGSDKLALDALLEEIPSDLLGAELDTCWLYSGGVDPIEYLHIYRGRSPLIHLKDCVKEGGRKGFRPVGAGVLDFSAILKECSHADWLCVEQDEPTEDMDAFACAAQSAANIRKILSES